MKPINNFRALSLAALIAGGIADYAVHRQLEYDSGQGGFVRSTFDVATNHLERIAALSPDEKAIIGKINEARKRRLESHGRYELSYSNNAKARTYANSGWATGAIALLASFAPAAARRARSYMEEFSDYFMGRPWEGFDHSNGMRLLQNPLVRNQLPDFEPIEAKSKPAYNK